MRRSGGARTGASQLTSWCDPSRVDKSASSSSPVVSLRSTDRLTAIVPAGTNRDHFGFAFLNAHNSDWHKRSGGVTIAA